MSQLTVIVPTHNPDRERLQRTFAGLRLQSLPVDQWNTLLIDNASAPAVEIGTIDGLLPNLRIVREPALGLAIARARGLRETSSEFVVFVDDDNVLASDYLEQTLAAFARLPRVGALGGKSRPGFERPPDSWQEEFLPLLALRDLGEREFVSQGLRPPGSKKNIFPDFAPIGAGLALRRAAVESWLQQRSPTLTDRQGSSLASAGDNEIVLAVMQAGWDVAYVPTLSLTHLIPAARLDLDYLARLNRGIQKSWMQVLSRYDANPWPSISRKSVGLRQVKAWFTHRAWSGPAAHIRWQGACGHFEGRAHDRSTF